MFTVGNMSIPDCCEVVTGEIRIFSGEFSELGTVGFSADGNVPALILLLQPRRGTSIESQS